MLGHRTILSDPMSCLNSRLLWDYPDRYKNERDTAKILLRRIGHGSRYADVSEDALNDCISAAQYEIGITLDETQRNAVITAIRNSTTVITGSPGSGKTTILNS